MKVRVNADRCEGHGRCYSTAPEAFVADDLGDGHEVGDGTVPEGLEAKALLAVANCPEQAITIEEG